MIVIKMSREEEQFSLDKLSQSIGAAHADTEEALDIDLLVAEFQSIIVDKDFLTTGQVKAIVCGLLYVKNALQTLENYAKFFKG